MEPNASQAPNQLPAANGLALVRVTIGAMFVWVFLRIWGKVSTNRQVTRV